MSALLDWLKAKRLAKSSTNQYHDYSRAQVRTYNMEVESNTKSAELRHLLAELHGLPEDFAESSFDADPLKVYKGDQF